MWLETESGTLINATMLKQIDIENTGNLKPQFAVFGYYPDGTKIQLWSGSVESAADEVLSEIAKALQPVRTWRE
jgi:hypothetical protein